MLPIPLFFSLREGGDGSDEKLMKISTSTRERISFFGFNMASCVFCSECNELCLIHDQNAYIPFFIYMVRRELYRWPYRVRISGCIEQSKHVISDYIRRRHLMCPQSTHTNTHTIAMANPFPLLLYIYKKYKNGFIWASFYVLSHHITWKSNSDCKLITLRVYDIMSLFCVLAIAHAEPL